MQPHVNDPRYIDWLVRLAEESRATGVIEEPRVLWDVVTLRSATPLVTDFTNDVFRNGEQFPYRITHLVVSPRPTFAEGAITTGADERLAQSVALRLRWHDAFYMNNTLLPAPLWSNKVLGAAESTSLGSVHWTLDRPVILSARDTFAIDVSAEPDAVLTAVTPYFVSCSMTGVGLLSKRPYFFGATKQISDTSKTTFSPTDFKNDGTEPIAITDIGFAATGGYLGEGSAAGDIRRWRFQVRQVGNGTQRPWFVGPTSGGTLCPGQLLGLSQGRSIVHRFPGDGLLWEPGEGCSAQASALYDDTQGMDYLVAFVGYIRLE